MIVFLSVLSALAETPPQSEALETKKAALIELRCNLVRDNPVAESQVDNNLTQIVSWSDDHRKLKVIKQRREDSQAESLPILRAELTRVENRVPTTDRDREAIEELYEQELRDLIDSSTVPDKSLTAIIARIAWIEVEISRLHNKRAELTSAVARVTALDQELLDLGIRMEQYPTSRHEAAEPDSLPITRCE